MIKKMFTSFTLMAALTGGFLWYKLGGSSSISPLPAYTPSELAALTKDPEFAGFLSSFTRVTLPLTLISDDLVYQSFTSTTRPGNQEAGGGRTARDLLVESGLDISDIPEVALDAVVPPSEGVEQAPEVATYIPFSNPQWVGVLLLARQFNDLTRHRQLSLTLATYDWTGQLIDQQRLATQTEQFDHSNDVIFEQYFKLTFSADQSISLATKTWRFIDRGGYATGGWQDQPGWQVSAHGQIEKSALPMIPRN